MGQGFTGAPYTYSQFTDLVFGPLPGTGSAPLSPSIIGDHDTWAFAPFMDDHGGAALDFDALFHMLHDEYFPRAVFGPVYLNPRKTEVFMDELTLLGFTGKGGTIRPSIKHRNEILNWPIPANKKELEAFVYLTPFLRIFIPGRADHVVQMKKAHRREERIPLPAGIAPPHSGKRKESVRKQWVETDGWFWGSEQQQSFDAIKRAIVHNAMSGADHARQYHLATEAGEHGVGGVFFQLEGHAPGIEIEGKLTPDVRIVLFMSFKLLDMETRYSEMEREALAVFKCLNEVKWLIIASPHPAIVYTSNDALTAMLGSGTDTTARIAAWMARLQEFDLAVRHRPKKNPMVGIADGLSRMPAELQDQVRLPEPALLIMAQPSAEEPLDIQRRP